MKTSSSIVLLAVVSVASAFIISDLKLKSEYDHHNIKDYTTYTPVPVFHYVRVSFLAADKDYFLFAVSAGKKNGVGSVLYEKEPFNYQVKADTLIIQRKNNTDKFYGTPIMIYCGALRGITAENVNMSVAGNMADSFSLDALGNANVSLRAVKTKNATIRAETLA